MLIGRDRSCQDAQEFLGVQYHYMGLSLNCTPITWDSQASETRQVIERFQSISVGILFWLNETRLDLTDRSTLASNGVHLMYRPMRRDPVASPRGVLEPRYPPSRPPAGLSNRLGLGGLQLLVSQLWLLVVLSKKCAVAKPYKTMKQCCHNSSLKR